MHWELFPRAILSVPEVFPSRFLLVPLTLAGSWQATDGLRDAVLPMSVPPSPAQVEISYGLCCYGRLGKLPWGSSPLFCATVRVISSYDLPDLYLYIRPLRC